MEVKVIKVSLSRLTGKTLYTLEIDYPRYIHAEVMTHREFSRNGQSYRAIPLEILIKRVLDNPVTPIFMKNQKGMQADIPLEGIELEQAKALWFQAMHTSISYARSLNELGVHKQVVNRIIEPYSNIKLIISTTSFTNFFNLRIAPDAQQEIQVLANLIKEAITDYKPDLLYTDEWHLPYITEKDLEYGIDNCRKMSVARCARVSYLNHDNSSPDIDKDLKLYKHLLESKHASAFEHVATPSTTDTRNFRGFRQQRSYVGL